MLHLPNPNIRRLNDLLNGKNLLVFDFNWKAKAEIHSSFHTPSVFMLVFVPIIVWLIIFVQYMFNNSLKGNQNMAGLFIVILEGN